MYMKFVRVVVSYLNVLLHYYGPGRRQELTSSAQERTNGSVPNDKLSEAGSG